MLQPAYAQSLEEHAVLAALTFNIVRLTSWPESSPAYANGELQLCLVGDNVVQQSFLSIDRKNFGKKTLNVINMSRLRNLKQCQVLYISELKQNLLQQVFIELNNEPILTIGESHQFAATGGMVGLENVNGKINILVNLAAVRQSGLNISSRLLKLAHIVDDSK
ncbi:MAG: YfiR family protein [Gammaproteobacteria bacterium]